MTPLENAQSWLEQPIDDSFKEQIKTLIQGDENELTDAFYKNLEFGTGGLRGIMGVGSNRMNKYTVGMATQGLANYIKKCFPEKTCRVAIAHDSRNNSDYFAEITANVFSANGIYVYLFEELRPTPELSFAIRHLDCQSGVVITASHNPKEYNGYKAYWEDGAQVTPPHDANIIQEVANISGFDQIMFDAVPENIERISSKVDEPYLDTVKQLAIDHQAIEQAHDVSLVYTPIHGTGITMVPKALELLGFSNVHIVEAQATPDGNFPTVAYPNPEESEALTLGLAMAQGLDADLLMATDPDGDRVGIAVKDHQGQFQLLNGNQMASLLCYYILVSRKKTNSLLPSHYMAKTIVTSELIDTMCSDFGVECFNTLTGFKYIAMVIREQEASKQFIGGGEESYGFMTSDVVRDKDAVATCALLAELAAHQKCKKQGIIDLLDEIYLKYGVWYETMKSITKKGKTGAEEIAKIMQKFREEPPTTINGSKVIKINDYSTGVQTDQIIGNTHTLDFPRSNVLQFLTEDQTKISARPSGTEPKIKFYFSVSAPVTTISEIEPTRRQLAERVEDVMNDLNL